MRVVSTGSIIVRNGLQLQILHKANSFSFTLAMEAERRRRLVLPFPPALPSLLVRTLKFAT